MAGVSPQISRQVEGGAGTGVPWLPILMYHRVVRQVEGRDPHGQQITLQRFQDQMQFLHRGGYQSLYLEEAAQAAGQEKAPWRKPVVITFDDGYEDTYTLAFPVLQQHQLRATVMVPSRQLGKTSAWYNGEEQPAPLMNLAQAREMARHGVRFGSHGKTHRSLTGLDTAEARQEIEESKRDLEQALGDEVLSFSYPFGRSNPALRKMVQEAGYSAACGIEQRDHYLFNLSRVDAASCRGGLAWRWKVSGSHYRMRSNPGLRRLKDTLARLPGV
jgi:peptidoglycan/xylan/chitin deacetylase (PgdA/CDA1 family)